MTFETTPIKKTSNKKVILHDMKELSTGSIMWFLVKRHKGGIIMTWAITMTALVLVPELPRIIGGLL